MDKFDRSLARIAKNIISAADSIDSVEGKLLLYLVAGEIGAEAMRPKEDPVCEQSKTVFSGDFEGSEYDLEKALSYRK